MTDDPVRAMDARSAVVAATLTCIAGAAVFLVQPGYVQALVDFGRLNADQAGFVAASEMAGIALTTFATSLVSHRWRWQPLLYAATGLALLGSMGCGAVEGFGWLLVMRFVAGLGGGVLISISFTAIGETRDPDRAFGFFMMWVLLYGAIGLWIMPRWLDLVGLKGLYVAIVFVVLVGLASIRSMPIQAGGSAPAMTDSADASRGRRMLIALSFFLFFLAAGILWAYLSLIGTAAALRPQTVANAVALSQATGVLGAMLPGLIGARYGRLVPLMTSIGGCALASAVLRPGAIGGALGFTILVCIFNFAWNVAQPVFLAAGSAFDRTGRLVAHMVTMQMLGLALGPFMGAFLTSAGSGAVSAIAAILFGVAAVVALPILAVRTELPRHRAL